MTTWPKDELRKIAEADALHIAPFREDGVTYGTPVPMRYRTVAARIDGLLWERLIESLPQDLSRPFVTSIQDPSLSNEAIKQAVQNQIAVPSAEVYRGNHLGVA